MTLDSITNSSDEHPPDRVFAYGVEGVGKTTWAACWPSPVFIAAEEGMFHLSASRFPQPETFQDVLDAVDTLGREPHDFQTVVFDTVDWIEHLVYDAVCKRCGWTAKEADKYGRWHKVAAEDWRSLISRLERLQRAKKMNVVFLAHAGMERVENPVGDDYARYGPKLQGKLVPALFREWCHAVLFMAYEINVKPQERRLAKATATGYRLIHTAWSPAWDAKNRYGLPEVLELDYDAYASARDAGEVATPEQLLAEFVGLAQQVLEGEALDQALAWGQSNSNNAGELARGCDRLNFKLQQMAQQEEES